MNKDTGLDAEDLKGLTKSHGGPLSAIIGIYPLKNGKIYVELMSTEKLRMPETEQNEAAEQDPAHNK